MIHPLNQPVKIPAETLEWAFSQNKNAEQAFGLAVDDMFKHAAMRKLQCTIPPQFAHYDLQMGDLRAEVKTTSKNSFTFSQEEYEFIRAAFKAEKQYKILFYFNDIEKLTTTFIGALNAEVIFEEGLFQLSNKKDKTQHYIFLSYVIKSLQK